MLLPQDVTRRHALLLDFDGTLVALAETPSGIQVPDGLAGVLGELFDLLGGAVAIISGRPVREIEENLNLPDDMPIAGVHGAEWRGEEPVRLDPIKSRLERIELELKRQFPGQLIETKSLALAIHYRGKPEMAEVIDAAIKQLCAHDASLSVIAGKAVFEIKPVWANKGVAVERLMSAPPFAGRTALMFGDDVTDEDGFRMAMSHGGAAVKVGEGDTAADYRIASPAEVFQWLAGVAGYLKERY